MWRGPIGDLRCAQVRQNVSRATGLSRANLPRGRDAKPGMCFSQEAQRPVTGPSGFWHPYEVVQVKANLARFTRAVVLLASMALTLGAGIKWDWW
jgi:hypothetical protein